MGNDTGSGVDDDGVSCDGNGEGGGGSDVG